MSTIEVSHGASAQTIEEHLMAEILSGAHRPGERLAEVALSQRFSVSRSPVREALRSLADAGLVTFVPNSGARVRVFTAAEAASLYELRVALESEAARLAARRCDPESGQALLALLENHAEAIAHHPTGAYLQNGRDKDFHAMVAQLSGNGAIHRLLTQELDPQLVLLRRQHRNVVGRGAVALREHQRVAEAVAAGDEELAALLMRRHIQHSWDSLKVQLATAEGAA